MCEGECDCDESHPLHSRVQSRTPWASFCCLGVLVHHLSSVVRRRELLWSVDAGAGRQPSVPGGVRRAGGVTVPFLVYHAFFQSNVR